MHSKSDQIYCKQFYNLKIEEKSKATEISKKTRKSFNDSIENQVYKLALQLIKYYKNTGNGKIPVQLTAKEATELKNRFAKNETNDLFYFALIGLAREFSINYSDKVGAVAITSTGNIYFGFNIEFPGLDVSSFIHAEQAAVANARIPRADRAMEKQIDFLYVSAAPCGSCRQMLLNANGNVNKINIRFPYNGQIIDEKLPHLIKLPFGDLDLNLFDIRDVSFSGIKKRKVLQDGFLSKRLSDVSAPTPIQEAAIRAALQGYTNKDIESYRGTAVELISETGRSEIFAGSYIESTGANHSIRPITQILVGLLDAGYNFRETSPVMNGHGERIVDARAVMVQGDDYPFSSLSETVLFVKKIAGSFTNRVELLTYERYSIKSSGNKDKD
ncbi:MAG: hypothetical protein HUU56_03160 [Bdellovibrionaceae bacterium]|nr:hypothetical protein [Pseudobdellovibrionaceae bacterium]